MDLQRRRTGVIARGEVVHNVNAQKGKIQEATKR